MDTLSHKDNASAVPDLATLQDDMTALKKDVGSLLDHLQKETVDGARGAVDRLEKQAEKFSHHIEGRPLTAVLVAAGIGYLGGRLLAR
jgi:ElaB/YqjD/DUF883 family membrane-anchored ribosome-binding protein